MSFRDELFISQVVDKLLKTLNFVVAIVLNKILGYRLLLFEELVFWEENGKV